MESIWSQSCEIIQREPLSEDINTEVAVIGAGMAGVLAAYKLQREGKQVVVLEAERIASGQTRNTTAKITSQHGLIYNELIKKFGEKKARQYAMANEKAIDEYKKIIDEDSINCEFEKQYAYVYSDNAWQLKEEAEAAAKLGLPADYVEDISISVHSGGAVRFAGQAQFNPLKFIKAISEKLTIYEETSVKSVKDNMIYTDHGTVRAEHIIFACHFPFVNFPGMYFIRMHQERSYVIALKNAADVNGMYIGADSPAYSFRNAGDLLLFGDENHRTGHNGVGGRYDALREKAKELFPNSCEVAHWSAQDCMTVDKVPYIGMYSHGHPNWYIASGFGKWGMTTSMAAAEILCNYICKKDNPYAEIFAPGRFTMGAIAGIFSEGGQSVKGLSKQIFGLPKNTADSIPIGHGGIVVVDGKKTGIYKDKNGTVYTVDTRCPHLGCQLEWNPDEKSWDCPCHGSRFDYRGNLISGPAQENISHL